MPQDASDSTQRFTSRVEDYIRWRPGYPEEVLETLRAETGLSPASRVADLGSGTGISTELLLRAGCVVYAVEPNAAMRAAAERRLGGNPRFHSVAEAAEATGLPPQSLDLVTAGQAFHWFDPVAARVEFSRILRPTGSVALFWNLLLRDATPFLRDYEALLQKYGTDYGKIDRPSVGSSRLGSFFLDRYRSFAFPNEQSLDHEGLTGRLLSSSFIPGPGRPGHDAMLRELRDIFDARQQNGRVRLLYRTELHLGA